MGSAAQLTAALQHCLSTCWGLHVGFRLIPDLGFCHAQPTGKSAVNGGLSWVHLGLATLPHKDISHSFLWCVLGFWLLDQQVTSLSQGRVAPWQRTSPAVSSIIMQYLLAACHGPCAHFGWTVPD